MIVYVGYFKEIIVGLLVVKPELNINYFFYDYIKFLHIIYQFLIKFHNIFRMNQYK